MAGMKITVDAAMRARDVSRPTGLQEEAAEAEPDPARPASPAGSARPVGSARPDTSARPARPARPAGSARPARPPRRGPRADEPGTD
jgi:hypothetical protein